jgi:diguanylate cyclase (GGDEF)-like protein
MDNAPPLPDILETTFDSLTVAAGVVVLLLALRVASTLTLSAHQRALRISVAAAILIVGANVAEVWADFSRLSTLKDVAGDLAELLAICSVGIALRLISRAEKDEISFLRRAANVDALTGLGSRSFFHRAAKRRIELYRSNGLPLACAMLDVDDFKSYNDRYGHDGGDKALRCVARVMRESARADDLLARYGGEEFVVLMGGNVEDAIKVAERVRERVESERVIGDEISSGSSLTVSVGVAPLTEDTSSLEQLVEAADGELYRAKRAGKNRVAAAGRRSMV